MANGGLGVMDMAAINARVVNPTVGDKVALALVKLGYEYESAGRIGLMYDQGVRDYRMPDAALVLGERIERDAQGFRTESAMMR